MTSDRGAQGKDVALIGDPVAHSVSPAMQRAAFSHIGLPLRYVALRIGATALPREFSRFRQSFIGLNVTAPLKEAVLPLVDRCSAEARLAGSVNTVVFSSEGALGYSTDGAGFLSALRHAWGGPIDRSLIVGSGGAARAVAATLVSEGTHVRVAGRDPKAVDQMIADLHERLGRAAPEGAGRPSLIESVAYEPDSVAQAAEAADVVVHATPAGGWPDPDSSTILNSIPLRPPRVVVDLVYRPRETRLLQRAQEAGCQVVEGVEMLIEQGARSFELWTGREAPREVMAEAAYRALEETPSPAAAGWRG